MEGKYHVTSPSHTYSYFRHFTCILHFANRMTVGETTRPVWLAAGREAQEINNSLSALFVSTTMESSGSNSLSCCQP